MNVVITGAGRGIGFELTKMFLTEGHNVFAFSRNVSQLEEFNMKYPNQFILESLDLSDFESLDRISELIKDWEQVDLLYNNAGILYHKPFSNVEYSDLENSWRVNYLAPFRIIQILLPKLHKNSHVVNISTMGAVQGSVKFAGLSAYSSSKAGIVTLTELLAEEFGENGPKINVVALGSVQTEMLEEAFPGLQAAVSPSEMAKYLYDFGCSGHHFFNGKILQASKSTP